MQCHRLEGQPDSRFNRKAPDLIWAGSKYKRPWLIRWLTGKEAPLYAKGYRWDLTEAPSKHPMVTEPEANAIADYFAEYNKDPRVKVGAFDLSKVTKFEAVFGGMAYFTSSAYFMSSLLRRFDKSSEFCFSASRALVS